MKKFLLTMLGAAIVAAPAFAQMDGVSSAPKVDVNKLRTAITKSDAEIADAKKAAKAATWLKRGEAFVNADAAPVNGIYAGMPRNMLELAFGDAPSATETIGDNTYTVNTYDHFKAYLSNGVVDFYVPTTVVQKGALDNAYDAYAKAYELDAKSVKKVGEGMTSIRTRSFETGGTAYTLGDYKAAAENFRRAFKASVHPSYGVTDTLAIYYAGMSAAYGEDYAASLVDLDKAISLGYEAEGDAYRLKFVDLYNLDRREESLEALKTGIARFPSNEQLIDMMMKYYAENDGDPTALIPMAQEAIAKNPGNPSLYQSLARIYDKLGQIDNAIASVHKAVELAPDDFLSNYLEGYFILKKGDEMSVELGKRNFTSNAQYNEAAKPVTDVFRSALAPLEKAYSLNPQEAATVELLKNLTARLRDEPGMGEKFAKYTELFNSMNK